MEILDGVWQFTSVHPEWDGEGEGWEPEVSWWAVQTETGALLIDPLVTDWEGLDALVSHCGGCAGIVRTCFWHERSIPELAARYAAEVWARPASSDVQAGPFDRAIVPGHPLPGDLLPFDAMRDDEVVLWLGPQRALIVGDVMIRDRDGTLRLCPDSWIERAGGPERVRAGLQDLLELPVEHVLVAHGPLVLGDGAEGLPRALAV